MFNPNEPRDEQGRWTDFEAGSAIREAASDKKVFKEAATIQEAEAHALKLGIKADYSNISVKMGNVINTELTEMYNKTNGFIMKSHVDNESFTAIKSIKALDMPSYKVANYNMLNGEIQINSRYWKDGNTWAEMKNNFKGTTLGEIHPRVALDHEIGHAYGKYWNSDGKNLYNTGQKVYANLNHNVISKYAMVNSEELVAESFAAYINYGKLPKELDEFTPIFKKILNQ